MEHVLTHREGSPSQTTAGGPSTLSFAKPRLVAKTTSGLRDSSPGSGLGISAIGGTKNAAEAQRAVWNKNQRMQSTFHEF